MNGGIYTNGPLYRPDPGAPVRDYKTPWMPPRYQPREIQIEQVALRPTPERVAAYRAEQTRAPTITPAQCARANAARATAAPAKRERKSRDASERSGARRAKTSMTQRILTVIRDAGDWITAERIQALDASLDHKKLKNLLHRYRSNGQIVTRRAADGTRLEYCWGPTARAQDPALEIAFGRGMSENSLTFWVCAVLRLDRKRWMSTEELAGAIGEATTTIERPSPAVISTRLSPLLRSGRLEKRRREGAKHGHGSTMEYRLIGAF